MTDTKCLICVSQKPMNTKRASQYRCSMYFSKGNNLLRVCCPTVTARHVLFCGKCNVCGAMCPSMFY